MDTFGNLCIAKIIITAKIETTRNLACRIGIELGTDMTPALNDTTRDIGLATDTVIGAPSGFLEAFEDVDPSSRLAAYGTTPAVLDTEIETAGVEILKVGEQRGSAVALALNTVG